MRGTILRCTGIRGYLRLSVTTKSYIHFFPGTHCPPTSGVVQTFLTGMGSTGWAEGLAIVSDLRSC